LSNTKLQDLSFLNLNATLANRYGLFTGLLNKSQQYQLPLSQTTSTSLATPLATAFTNVNFPTSTPYLHLITGLNGVLTGTETSLKTVFSLTLPDFSTMDSKSF
jgi:hypothetical protein